MDKLKHKILHVSNQTDPPIFKNITIRQMTAIPRHTSSFPLFRGSYGQDIPLPSLLYVLYAIDWLNKMGLIVIDELVHVCVCVCLVVVCPSWRLGRS